RVLVRSAFRAIRGGSKLVGVLKQLLVTRGFVPALDPNDLDTRARTHGEGVFLIPTGTGGQSDIGGEATKGRRVGGREVLLRTKKQHPQCLVVVRNVHVHQVLFDAGTPARAIGVQCTSGAHQYRASPRHATAGPSQPVQFFVREGGEVVLSGGAFNTPQILML